MSEQTITNFEELTDEQLEAMSGGYIVDLSEHKGYSWFAFVNDKTGKVIAYSNMPFAFDNYRAAKENCLEMISMDRYAEMFGRKFYS